MDDLRKIHVSACWVLVGCSVAIMLVQAVNGSAIICLAVGVSLLAFARFKPGR